MITRIRALLLACLLLQTVSLAKPPVTDSEISTKVQLKLAEDTVVKGGALSVSVSNGVVTLAGAVKSPKLKTRAGMLAQKVSGVKAVVNNIQVRK